MKITIDLKCPHCGAVGDATVNPPGVSWARRAAGLDVPCTAMFCDGGARARGRTNGGREVTVRCPACQGAGWVAAPC